MSKITYSIQLDFELFKASELGTLFTEMETQVNTGLDTVQFKLNTIRYRHLKQPVFFALSARALGTDIDTVATIPDDGVQYPTERPYLEFKPTYNKDIAIVLEFWFYGYYYKNLGTKFGIARRDATTLVYERLPDTEIQYGVDRADPNSYSAYAPVGGGGGPQKHYITGVAGWLPPSAGLTRPVIITATMGPTSMSEEEAYGWDRYKATVRFVAASGDGIGAFDKLYLFGYARDNAQ